jgi:predicted MFS family arabinose efflux permease
MSIGNALSAFRLREFNENVRSFFRYGVAINAGMALFALLFNLYLLRLGYQEDFIGQVASMAPLACGIMAMPIGMLSDRFGRKPFMIGSGLLLAIAQLGLCLATTPAALLAMSFVGGVGSAFIWVNHVPFLSENARPSRRAEALVIWSALQIVIRMVLSLAGGFMPGIMAYFLDTSTDLPDPFRYSLFLGAACSLASVIPLLRIPGGRAQQRPATEQLEDEVEADRPRLQARRVLAVIAASGASRGFTVGLTYPFFNVFFEEELHLGPVAIGVTFFLSQLFSLPATLSAPSLVRKFGATLTILSARVIGGVSIGIMGAFIGLPVAVPMFLVTRLTEVIDNPSDQNFTTQILPRRYWARVQGFRVGSFQLLHFLGSLLGGMLIVDYGYGVAFGLACVSRIVSGLIMGAFFGIKREPR